MADGSGRISFDWADGTHTFRLPIEQLRELQDKTGVGPAALLDRIHTGSWKVDDLREVIRLGLIGAGMDPIAALTVVRQYVDRRPLIESVSPALVILAVAVTGPWDDEAGKPEAPTRRRSASPSAPSTAQPQ